jgi:hypothetical protein
LLLESIRAIFRHKSDAKTYLTIKTRPQTPVQTIVTENRRPQQKERLGTLPKTLPDPGNIHNTCI